MARGSAVREFVSSLRDRFYAQLDITDKDNETEFFGYTVQHAFEKAVNDVLLGNGSETKVEPKPRRRIRSKKQMENAAEQSEATV